MDIPSNIKPPGGIPERLQLKNPKDYGIELWIDSGNRLMLSDPERPPHYTHAEVKNFRLPLENENGIFGYMVFDYVQTIKGRRMFQASALYSEPDPQHSQSALWSDVLGLRREGT